MTPNFPFKCPYVITQSYADDDGGIYNGPLDGGHHGGIDFLPLQNGQPFPAQIYPTFDGSELSIQDTDPVKGKGVRERVFIDDALIAYCQSKGVIPTPTPTTTGRIVLDILYWHMLDVTDKDGILTIDTPIGHAGNTGDVYHDGVAVPDSQKGVPPYLGLHLHYEHRLGTEMGVIFNLDKDPQGRIDPSIILNLKLMNQTKVVLSKDGVTVWLAVPIAMDWANFEKQASVEGIEIPNPIPPASSL